MSGTGLVRVRGCLKGRYSLCRTIFWLRILTRERVKEVTQGRYEGWVGGGGGWAEDMEGRSVLSLTLVYIKFLFAAGSQPASGSQPANGSQPHTGHGRHRCDFFIIRKELGKGEGVESSGYQGIFFFFFPDPKREVTQGTIF